MRNVYVALLCVDGTEPDPGSGYARTSVGEIPADQLDQIPAMHQIEFPDVCEPGYQPITAFAAYDQPQGGMRLKLWQLPQSVQVNVGEVPVIHHGQLLRGVAVQAKIISQAVDACGLLGGGF